jgi:hypothetical protein
MEQSGNAFHEKRNLHAKENVSNAALISFLDSIKFIKFTFSGILTQYGANVAKMQYPIELPMTYF